MRCRLKKDLGPEPSLSDFKAVLLSEAPGDPGHTLWTERYLQWILLLSPDSETRDLQSELVEVVLLYGVVVLLVLHLTVPLFLTLKGEKYIKWECLHHKLLLLNPRVSLGWRHCWLFTAYQAPCH